MKKLIRCSLLVLLVGGFCNTQDTSARTAEPQAFNAGGTSIVIPAPTKDMVELGDEKREVMEVFVPPNNRLLAEFVPANDLPRFAASGGHPVMTRYGAVEVSRRGENTDMEASNFNTVVGKLKARMGDLLSSSTENFEEDFHNRLKSQHFEDATVSLGQPIQLGCILSKQDAYGFAAIVPLSTNGKTTNMGGTTTLVRVKKRLVFIYLYSEYKNEETLKWLRETSVEWVDAILSANK
jgi:hypothetical protein